jgi:hypothetical protein
VRGWPPPLRPDKALRQRFTVRQIRNREPLRYSRSMNGEAELVTVYRSADADADQDAGKVQAYLLANGVDAVIYNDDAPGVVQGSYEVRVAAPLASQAETLLGAYDPDAPMAADPSSELDSVTLTERMGATGEIEVMAMKNVLDAAGIESIIIGDSALPNLSFQLQVAKADVAAAQEVIAEAEAAGPAAAAEAERESELNPTGGPQA